VQLLFIDFKEFDMKKMVSALMVVSLLLAASAALAAGAVSLPKGYESWEKSRQKIVEDKKSLFYGVHTLYVDKKGLNAYKTGGSYPEGSRFVVVFYNLKEEGGKQVAGKKNMIVLMQRDKKQTETGGWLFAGFGADGKPSGIDPVKNCFSCHQKDAADRQFVISKYEDFTEKK
jgi:Cytochrome P460